MIEHDVIDYAAFSFDASKRPSRVFFAGTLFETPIEGPMPAQRESAKSMMTSMQDKGDIFRQPPPSRPANLPEPSA